MDIYVYDIEVFKYDWLVIFKSVKTKEYFIFHNDNYQIKEFMKTHNFVACGFNEKHYDCHILKAIVCGADNALVKDINDWIISGNQGFDHWFIKQNYFWFDHFDIRDDMQAGLSLKAIEGHLGMNIEETEVDFNLDRPLTEEELQRTIKYCKHDVDTTEEVMKLRKNYLDNKIYLGKLKGVSPVKALSMTNAKLTALYLDAKAKPHNDERDYKYPTTLLREYIPDEVFEFFDKLYDKNISDDDLFKGKLELDLGDCKGVLGYGGIHAAIPNYKFMEERE